MAKKTGKENAGTAKAGPPVNRTGLKRRLRCVQCSGACESAAVRADDIKGNAEAAEFPVLCLAVRSTEQAFNFAARCPMDARKNPPTVADFVNLFAELHECRSRARELLEGQDKGGCGGIGQRPLELTLPEGRQ